MRVLSLVLPALAYGQLNFNYDVCENYCLSVNEFSFTYTKNACPVGGESIQNGGFKPDECDADDPTITYNSIKDGMLIEVTRETSIEEAMRVCGDDQIVTLENGTEWWSPEYKFRQSVSRCRNHHGEGTGWDGMEGIDDATDTKSDDVDYRECLQEAYDDCQENEPWVDECKPLLEIDVADMTTQQKQTWYTFCWDKDDDMQRRTCDKYKSVYNDAEQSCFEDDKLKGYQACIQHAQNVYALEVQERQQICKKTFIVGKNNIACEDAFGYVLCCCQVIGTMITHPPEAECTDQYQYTKCKKWADQGRCDPNHGDYMWMAENCEHTCGLCSIVPPTPAACPTGGSSKDTSGCMCMDDYAKEMAYMTDGWTDYMKLVNAADPDMCEQLSGTYRGGECKPAKNADKVKCSNATDKAVCRALGCNLAMKFNGAGGYDFACTSKPNAIM